EASALREAKRATQTQGECGTAQAATTSGEVMWQPAEGDAIYLDQCRSVIIEFIVEGAPRGA
ncbi:MAG: hypothetical protein OEQ13_14255, partial [Acidobacteriota bacterium]|nr:hypothetical protein [Acidobacteriota bacterium]